MNNADSSQMCEKGKKDNIGGKQLVPTDKVEDDDVCIISSSNKENDADAINL